MRPPVYGGQRERKHVAHRRSYFMQRNTRNAKGNVDKARQPLLENLEGRQMFTVVVALTAADTLTFTGNNAADTISIQDNGAGVISGSATGPGGAAAPFGPFFNIRQVSVNSNGGDDAVTYQFTGDMLGGPFAK